MFASASRPHIPASGKAAEAAASEAQPHPPLRRTSFPGPAMVRLGAASTSGQSEILHSRPRVPAPPPLRPRASRLPAIAQAHTPAFRVISFNVSAGSGTARLTPSATSVRIDSPTFTSSAFVMGVGTPELLAGWELGYVQTITGHFLRDEYEHTTADWVVGTPIRDSADGVAAPWYHTHTPPLPGNRLTRVTMDDTPFHYSTWADPRTFTPNSLTRSSRRLELTAWLIAQNRATHVPIYLKNVNWAINITVNVDRSRPVNSRAMVTGPAMSTPVVGDDRGSLTPTVTASTYNSVVNGAGNPNLIARGGSTANAATQSLGSRPALDGSAPSIRLNPAAASSSTYSPRHIAIGCGAGAPLPPAVQLRLGQQFSADLGSVRVHTDARAQQAARSLSARAVTYGNQILLAPGEQPTDLRLMAHETAHVVQQGYAPVAQRGHESRSVSYEHEAHQAADAVVRQQPFTVQQRTSQPRVQRLGVSDILEGLAELAANLPGFTLLTVIIGRNPLTLRRVERNFTTLLRGFMGLIPGGGEILFQVLNRYAIVERLGNWVSDQVSALGINYDYLRGRFDAFTGTLGLGDLLNPSGVWQRATTIFNEPINRIRTFASRLITQAITWLKETFMQPLSNFCREIPGYTLVTVLLGRDPFTNAPVERSALNVVRAFAEFIPGGTEKVNQLVESRALQRAYEWFLQETQARNLTWARVTGTFAAAWDSLRLEDVLHPIETLQRMITMFRPLMTDLVSFAGAALMKLLELIFEAAMGSGGARILAILKRGRDTFLTIIRDPVGFLGNLLRAVGQGVRQFMGNILTHLRTGVIAWLTGPVAAAGVQMPEQWDLRGIIWFVMQILGLTWPRVRQKLVRLMGDRMVGMLESGFQLIQEIRERGLVQALRDRVTEFFGQLREAALGSIRSFIQQRLVMAGIQQLLSLLSPVGAVIQAIIKTYTTIQFFIQRINQILDLVESVVNSIAAIASGSIGAAANFIERTMARTIPVILDFLARFIGLGDVGGQVQRTIQGLQARVDQMLDRAVEWIRTMAQRLATAVRSGVSGLIQWWRRRRRIQAGGETHTLYFSGEGRSARLFIESAPTPFETFVRDLPGPPAQKERALALATQIDQLRNRSGATNGELNPQDRAELENQWNSLAQEVIQLLSANLGPSAPPQYGSPTQVGFGTSVVVAQLNRPARGTAPRESNDTFDTTLAQRLTRAGGPASGNARSRPYYWRGHLLGEHHGGPGEWRNMAPITQPANTNMESQLEGRISSRDQPVHFEVIARYGRGANPLLNAPELQDPQSDALRLKKRIIAAEQHIPTSLLFRVFSVDPSGAPRPGLSLTGQISNAIDDRSLADYAVAGQAAERLKHLAINDSLAQAQSETGRGRHRTALAVLPGVGPTTLRNMIAHGPYGSFAEMYVLRGITEETVRLWNQGIGGVTISLNGVTQWQ